MTQTPILTGQDIGQASRATRAVLDRLLADTGTGFNNWVTLSLLGDHGPNVDEDRLVGRVVQGLRVDEPVVRDVLTQLLDQGLVERTSPASGPQISLTSAGADRVHQIKSGIGQITERLYGGLPAEDLAVAHRMLAAVTARANAELDG